MVSEGHGRLFRRKDKKYLLYLPVKLAEDSMFPFNKFSKSEKGSEFVDVKVSFEIGAHPMLVVEKWKEQ